MKMSKEQIGQINCYQYILQNLITSYSANPDNEEIKNSLTEAIKQTIKELFEVIKD